METLSNISLYIPIDILETMLNNGLGGLSLAGLPLRTRSKFVKSLVCKALGYSVPDTFQKTKPDFPAQNLDVYTQKSKNVQIWNEAVDPVRRYAFIQVDESDKILKVRVITGEYLAKLDKTGTLTTKYQAMMPDTAASQQFFRLKNNFSPRSCPLLFSSPAFFAIPAPSYLFEGPGNTPPNLRFAR